MTDRQYELTPFEFGSWNGRVQAFADMQYLGTNLTGGQPAQNYCVQGYDVAAYLGGSSLSALNLC
jgi:lysophospholipase